MNAARDEFSARSGGRLKASARMPRAWLVKCARVGVKVLGLVTCSFDTNAHRRREPGLPTRVFRRG